MAQQQQQQDNDAVRMAGDPTKMSAFDLIERNIMRDVESSRKTEFQALETSGNQNTFGGLVGDSAWTYAVGEISDEKKRLLKVTEKSLFAGIAQMRHGNILDMVSGAIEDVANREPNSKHYQLASSSVLKQLAAYCRVVAESS
jgi:methionine aminopeptidase